MSETDARLQGGTTAVPKSEVAAALRNALSMTKASPYWSDDARKSATYFAEFVAGMLGIDGFEHGR